MSYTAIDPGDNVGWATFDDKGEFTGFGEIKGHDAFLDWLEKDQASVIIVESYRARPGKINSWSRLPTVQLIGAIKRIAHKRHAKVIEQDPNPCLSIGLRFIGLHTEYKGKHVPDKISALAHGTYYLRKERILK
jgi:hypothetical protein